MDFLAGSTPNQGQMYQYDSNNLYKRKRTEEAAVQKVNMDNFKSQCLPEMDPTTVPDYSLCSKIRRISITTAQKEIAASSSDKAQLGAINKNRNLDDNIIVSLNKIIERDKLNGNDLINVIKCSAINAADLYGLIELIDDEAFCERELIRFVESHINKYGYISQSQYGLVERIYQQNNTDTLPGNILINYLIHNPQEIIGYLDKLDDAALETLVSCTSCFSSIPDGRKSKKICRLAVSKDGRNIKYTPGDLLSKELCEIACRNNGRALEFVPDNLLTEALREIACKHMGANLALVPEELRTKKLCEIACRKTGNALKSVPMDLRNKALCKIACSQNGYALRFVPEQSRTKKLYEIACRETGGALEFVPEELRTGELCKIAILSDADSIRYVPDKQLTRELLQIALKLYALKDEDRCLEFYHCIPDRFKNKEFYMEIIKINSRFSKCIPTKMIDFELFKLICSTNVNFFQIDGGHWLPEQYRSNAELMRFTLRYNPSKANVENLSEELFEELAETAIRSDPEELSNMPDSRKDAKLCKLACQINGEMIIDVPEGKKTLELCKIACRQCPKAALYVPWYYQDKIPEVADYYKQNIFLNRKELIGFLLKTNITKTIKRSVIDFIDRPEISPLKITDPQRVIRKESPLVRPIYNPFIEDLLFNCYAATGFKPGKLEVGEQLVARISQAVEALSNGHMGVVLPEKDNPIPADSVIVGGRALKSRPMADGFCQYYKFQRAGETLTEFLQEGITHQFLDDMGLRDQLKSTLPVYQERFRLKLSDLPEQTRDFSDELEITTIDGEPFVNVYCYRAGADYCTYAHQPDTNSTDPFARPEQGLLKACYDIGVFMGWGMLPTSTLGAFHNSQTPGQGRQWIALNSAFSGDDSPAFPGILEDWNGDATAKPDFGYDGFRDIGDFELFGSVSSYQSVERMNPYGHPEAAMRILCYANCSVENILAIMFIWTLLHQHQDDYHCDNAEAVEQTGKFFESAIMAHLSGMKSVSESSTVPLQDMLSLDAETYQRWLTRSAEEIVYWTTRQPRDKHDLESYKPYCYATHINNDGQLSGKLYPEPAPLSYRPSYPASFTRKHSQLCLGKLDTTFPLLSPLSGLLSIMSTLINPEFRSINRAQSTG